MFFCIILILLIHIISGEIFFIGEICRPTGFVHVDEYEMRNRKYKISGNCPWIDPKMVIKQYKVIADPMFDAL